MELPVPPLLHVKIAPGAPVAVNTELPQLLVTETDGIDGIELTVNVTAFEVAVPAMLVHTARYCLLLSAVVVVNDKGLLVAPLILFQVPLEFTCHCTVGAGPPLASELNITSSPAHFACGVGWIVIDGATMPGSTPTVTNTFCVLVHPFADNVYT